MASGSVNRAIIVGTLGRDPELKYTTTGQAVCSLAVATSESWKDKQGDKQERTEWHRIKAWGKLAELCGQYLLKGRQIYAEGKIQTHKYQAKDGTDRYSTEIVAQTIQFLGGKKDDAQPQAQARVARAEPEPMAAPYGRQMAEMALDESDIPF